MTRAALHTREARDVADWLDEQGEHFRTQRIRNVCRSLDTARTTLATLHKDNTELRARIASGGENGHQGDGS